MGFMLPGSDSKSPTPVLVAPDPKATTWAKRATDKIPAVTLSRKNFRKLLSEEPLGFADIDSRLPAVAETELRKWSSGST